MIQSYHHSTSKHRQPSSQSSDVFYRLDWTWLAFLADKRNKDIAHYWAHLHRLYQTLPDNQHFSFSLAFSRKAMSSANCILISSDFFTPHQIPYGALYFTATRMSIGFFKIQGGRADRVPLGRTRSNHKLLLILQSLHSYA